MEADDLLKVPVLGDVVKVGCDFLVRHMLCRFNQLCQDALLEHHALAFR